VPRTTARWKEIAEERGSDTDGLGFDRTFDSGEFQDLRLNSMALKMHGSIYDAILFHKSPKTIEQATEIAVQIAVAMYWP